MTLLKKLYAAVVGSVMLFALIQLWRAIILHDPRTVQLQFPFK